MCRQFFLFAMWLILSAARLHGQYYFYNDHYYNTRVLIETGLSAGGFNCLTDLGGGKGHGKSFVKDINWKNTHAGGGIYMVVLFDQLFGLRFEGSVGKISASDDVLKNDHSAAKNRFHRNLSFETYLAELSLSAEFHPLSCLTKESYPLFSPYLLAGVGMFRYNPKANLHGQWIELHPLRTEGQGFKEYAYRDHYKLTQINFPVGFGVRYELSALLNARLEFLYRLLKTDYLDDVSTRYINPDHFHSNLNQFDVANAIALSDRSAEIQGGATNPEAAIRGNPANRDAYFSFNLKLGVILNRKRR